MSAKNNDPDQRPDPNFIDPRMERIEIGEAFVKDVLDYKAPVGIATGMLNATAVEIAYQIGAGWILADREHTLMSNEQLIEIIRVAERYRMPVLVKLNSGSQFEIRDALDAGAHGIMHPFTNTAEQLREVLAHTKFNGHGGTRGYCPVARTGHYAVSGNSTRAKIFWSEVGRATPMNPLVIPSIESEEALENIEELIAIDECPIWHVGAGDLGLSLGVSQKEGKKAALWATAQLRKANKIICAPFEPHWLWPDDENLRHTGLPYTFDTSCLGYGIRTALQMAKRQGVLTPEFMKKANLRRLEKEGAEAKAAEAEEAEAGADKVDANAGK